VLNSRPIRADTICDVDDITSPLVEESAPVDESAPADLSADLDRLAVVEADLAQAEAELDALDAAPSVDADDPDDAPAS
jgi:hypothetical protein